MNSDRWIDRRGTPEYIKFLLDKHRADLMKKDNERRRALKTLSCEYCFTFNGCTSCRRR